MPSDPAAVKIPCGPKKNIKISLTIPALPKRRISDMPTTNGGVIIGRM